jgi:hypothetical protein
VGELINAYRLLVEKSERKRQLGRFRRRWENKSEMDFREIGWKFTDCIHLAPYKNQW